MIEKHYNGNSFLKGKQYLERNSYLIIVVFCVFSLLMFFARPTLSLSIETDGQNQGELELQYINSFDKQPDLSEYYKSLAIVSFGNEEKNNIKFQKIPITTNVLHFSVYGARNLTINKIKIYFWGVPIKNISAEALYREINDSLQADYFPELNVVSLKQGADDLFDFKVSGTNYFLILSFICIVFLVVSIIISKIVCKYLPLIKNYVLEILLISSSMQIFILTELVTYNFWYIDVEKRILNFLILFIIYLLVFIIIYKPVFCICLCNAVIFTVSIINYYVLIFRGKPILPWDLSAFNTALNVAKGYDFEITVPIALGVAAIGMQMFFLINFKKILKCRKRNVYSFFAIPIAICLFTFTFGSKTFAKLEAQMWDTDIVYWYKTQGLFASFCKYGETARVKPPDGYSLETLEEVHSYIIDPDKKSEGTKPQNIIMIMNESFADMHVLGKNYLSDELKFFNSLKKKSIYGNLYTSVRGGSTCNTEFETLTGNSLVFLPPGSFPFQNYINRNTYSVANTLKNDDYLSTAFHLENGKNWNRNNVYPYLGFDHFFDITDFNEILTVRGRATDSYNYQQLINLYEQNKGTKQYIYNITIQNHGGYSGFGDLPQLVDLSQDGDLENAEVFLSLMKLSDQSFKELIDYFKKIPEPTMIIIYGDHQPKLDDASEKWFNDNEDTGSIQNNLKHYITPFMIWRNYNDESKYIDKISANYFSSLILSEANVELPIYNQFLLELYKKYPVFTTQGIIDNADNYYLYEDIKLEDSAFKMYEYLQYNNMFDEKNRENGYFDLQP